LDAVDGREDSVYDVNSNEQKCSLAAIGCSLSVIRCRTPVIASSDALQLQQQRTTDHGQGTKQVFVDRVTIFVKGGDGGNGCVSFRREKYIPKGGPDGGDGGRGGSVIIRARAGADNLAGITHRKHWRADSGQAGSGSNCSGRSAEDLIVEVPPGTVIIDRDRGHILKDLVAAGDQVTVGHGGMGGRGNKHFATATNQTPREFEEGEAGEERWIVLELKMIADVGLIGLPNAGKSTLLSRLSRARPEIADYPFTTKYPNLGMVSIDEENGFVLADIPGLIEGAHQGTGLGHEFLRHVERTRVLVHLVEPMPLDGSDPVENYRTIRKELDLYGPHMTDKPELVVISKSELTDPSELRTQLEKELHEPVLAISAVTGQGLAELVSLIAQRLREAPI
jgi:GTP-binding protein